MGRLEPDRTPCVASADTLKGGVAGHNRPDWAFYTFGTKAKWGTREE